MTTLCIILGDQLNETIASLAAINKQKDIVFLCEVAEETSYVPHHPKKIAFLFSAMRHFAQQLKKKGYRVRYTAFDDPRNQGSFAKELLRAIEEEQVSAISLTEPGEWRVLKIFHDLKSQLTIPVTLHEDNRFLCKINEFRNWAKEKNSYGWSFFTG